MSYGHVLLVMAIHPAAKHKAIDTSANKKASSIPIIGLRRSKSKIIGDITYNCVSGFKYQD